MEAVPFPCLYSFNQHSPKVCQVPDVGWTNVSVSARKAGGREEVGRGGAEHDMGRWGLSWWGSGATG